MRGRVSITVQRSKAKPRVPDGMKLHFSRSGVFATALARDGRVLRVAGATTEEVTVAMTWWLRWETRCAADV